MFYVDARDGEGIRRLNFDTPQELIRWVDKECEYWSWIANVSAGGIAEPAGTFINNVNQSLANVHRKREAARQEPTPTSVPDLAAAASELFSSLLFTSDSPQAKYVEQVRGIVDAITAVFAVSVIARKRSKSERDLVGVALGAQYLLFGTGDPYSESANSRLHRMEQEYAQLEFSLRERFSELENQCNALVTAIDSSKKDMVKQFDGISAAHRSVLSLQEPANYWSKKSDSHYKFAMLFALVTMLAAVIGGVGLVCESYAVQKTVQDITNPSPWLLIPYSFPLLVSSIGLFWLLRILVRILLSHFHLMSDASERVKIIQTYQSLELGNQQLPNEAFTIVLGQIFRHAATGVVKDDASPPLWYSALTSSEK